MSTSSVVGVRPVVSGVHRTSKRLTDNTKAVKKTLEFFIKNGFWCTKLSILLAKENKPGSFITH
jgi:hypothetical protein